MDVDKVAYTPITFYVITHSLNYITTLATAESC